MVIHVYINGNVALNCIFTFLVKNIFKPLPVQRLRPFFSSFYGYGFVALKGWLWATETLMCMGNGNVCDFYFFGLQNPSKTRMLWTRTSLFQWKFHLICISFPSIPQDSINGRCFSLGEEKHFFTGPNPGADQEFINYFTKPILRYTLKIKYP